VCFIFHFDISSFQPISAFRLIIFISSWLFSFFIISFITIIDCWWASDAPYARADWFSSISSVCWLIIVSFVGHFFWYFSFSIFIAADYAALSITDFFFSEGFDVKYFSFSDFDFDGQGPSWFFFFFIFAIFWHSHAAGADFHFTLIDFHWLAGVFLLHAFIFFDHFFASYFAVAFVSWCFRYHFISCRWLSLLFDFLISLIDCFAAGWLSCSDFISFSRLWLFRYFDKFLSAEIFHLFRYFRISRLIIFFDYFDFRKYLPPPGFSRKIFFLDWCAAFWYFDVPPQIDDYFFHFRYISCRGRFLLSRRLLFSFSRYFRLGVTFSRSNITSDFFSFLDYGASSLSLLDVCWCRNSWCQLSPM